MELRPDPWERQPREAAKAYAAFCAYRDMPAAQRSRWELARQLAKSRQLVSRWSARWRWVERAEAWDAELDRQKRLKQVEAIQEMAERQAGIALMYQQKILERLREVDAGQLGIRDLATWLDVATKVEREARGVPQRLHLTGYLRTEIGQRVRELATELGLNPDEACAELEQMISANSVD